MRTCIKILFLLIISISVNAQQSYPDSLKKVLQYAKEDSTKTFVWGQLSYYYSFLYPDSALYYADTLIHFSEEQNYSLGKALGYIYKGEALDRFANYPEALVAALHSLEIATTLSSHRSFVMGRAYDLIGHLNSITGKHKEAISNYYTAAALLKSSNEHLENFHFTYFQMAYSMMMTDRADSALYYVKKGEQFFTDVEKRREATPWLITGNIYMHAVGNIDSAEYYFREGIQLSQKFNSLFISAVLYNSLADIFYRKKKMDSCFYYAQKSLFLSQKYKYKLFEINASGFLSYVYDTINVDSAYKYLKIMVAANQEVFNDTRGQQFQKAMSDAEKREKELEDAKTAFQNKIKMYGLIIILIFFIVIAIIFWRNNLHRKRANALLTHQKEKVESTLSELKSTQAQLIQSEKMASLGALTAGIAHEIQNPLNFVNNFSEVNTELIDELQQELKAGKIDDAISISNDIKDNEEKINHHGKRAGDIVKGMLQHSRTSSGVKEPTDINALCDEYLRLSYNGLRAKDKDFNATMQTNFDESIGKINIVPQDMGRVILNLINNAFYAVNEKKKASDEKYEPIVSISTKKIDNKISISVKDNGNGIPQKIVDKIFQPFFTTKPTGQGTGLGLSLSYDIIKAHGGEIKVETKEGEGSEFIIQLPA